MSISRTTAPSALRFVKLIVSALLLAASLLVSSTASAQSGYYATGHYASPEAAAYAQQQAAYQNYVAQQQAYAAYQQQQAAAAAYYAQQQQAAAYQAYMAQQQAQARIQQAPPAPRATELIRFDGRYASISASTPVQVQYAVNAANYIQGKPYVRGAGHQRLEDGAYDCSSSTSYALIKAGLLRSPLTSQGFATYGEAGPGRFITLWVKPGEHVFMTICGLRLDTSGGAVGEGPRWRTKSRSMNGFIARHPAGL